MNLGGLIHHLVHREGQEVAEHDVDHRAHAGHRRADTYAGETSFGDGRIDDAVGAEFFDESGEDFERCAGLRDVFAEDADAGIAAHLFGESFAHGLRECQFSNLSFSLRHKRPAPLLRGSG